MFNNLFSLSLPFVFRWIIGGTLLACQLSLFANYYTDESSDSSVLISKETSLCGYLQIAATNNQELRAAFTQWKAAMEVILEVNTLPDPRFTFKYFIVPVETRTGPQRASYSLIQTFPWMGKLKLKGEKAEQEAYILKARFDQLLLEVFLEVKKAYYEYSYLMKAIGITKEILDILKYVDGVSTSGYSVGDVLFSDVIRIQVELGRVEDHLRTLEDLKRPIVAKLNATMNLPMTTQLPLPASVPMISILQDGEKLASSLSEHNPQLVSFDYLAKSERIGIRLAKKEFYPDFTFGIESIATGSARMPGVKDSGKDPVIATLSINVPLWQKNRRATLRRAEKLLSSAEDDRIGLEEKLLADLELSMYKHRDAIRKVNLYGDSLVPKAKESLSVVIDAFVTQKQNFVDLVDAERTLLELQLAYERSLADQAIYASEIEALVVMDWHTSCDEVREEK